MADITAILQATQSHDANARVAAEAQLKAAQESNFPGFLTSLAGEIANEQKPPTTRQLAGLLLKNSLDARDENRKAELVEKWLQQDPTIRNQIKGAVWNTLSSSDPTVRHTSAQVVAKIAGAEIPAKQWPDLVQNLQNNVSNGTAPGLKQATLEALGFVCEEIDAEHLEEAEVNAMLTAIVQGMRKEEPDVEIRLAACVALRNALYFAVNNFEHDNERNYIMQVTCEATVCDDVRVRVAAYEVLVGVAENYYQHLQPYMTAIFDLSVKATKSDDETVALQAIEFWSAICEEEIDRQEEIDDANTAEAAAAVAYHRFIEKALPMLVPMLLETLTKQDEDQVDDGDDAWNVAMAGGTCLRLVATCVQDAVVDHVMPFITAEHLRPSGVAPARGGDVRVRVASWRARTRTSSRRSRRRRSRSCSTATKDADWRTCSDTTAWTVGRVFEFVGQASPNVPPVVSAANLDANLKADRGVAARPRARRGEELLGVAAARSRACAGEDDHAPHARRARAVFPRHRPGAHRGERARATRSKRSGSRRTRA